MANQMSLGRKGLLCVAIVSLLIVVLGATIAWINRNDSTSVDRTRTNFQLIDAARKGDLVTMKRLMDEGVPANAKDLDNSTPLHAAALSGELDVIELLLAHGADPNSKDDVGRTPLFYAVKGGNIEVCRILVRSGAHVDSADDSGQTPLSFARALEESEIVVILSEQGLQEQRSKRPRP